MIKVSNQFIEDLIDSIECLLEEEEVSEGCSLPEILQEAKKYMEKKDD